MMRIALVSSPCTRIPPQNYGGTERIVSLLADGLAARGHDVTLFATGDSETSGKLRSIYPTPTGGGESLWAQDILHTHAAFAESDRFELVHDHTSDAGFALSLFSSTPTLHTLHCGVVTKPANAAFYRSWPGKSLVVLSESQRRLLSHPEPVWTVYNALDIDHFPLERNKDDYLLHVGRLEARKGTHLAIEVAKRTGQRLILAGIVPDEHFFARKVAPHIDGTQIQYVGPVGGEDKVKLFQHAKAFLFPVQWEEPFGIVLIEAMSCGTPVVAFDCGAVAEVVDHGRTGFIVSDLDEMCDAVGAVSGIEPSVCHSHVEQRFGAQQMVSNYEAVYRAIITEGGREPNAGRKSAVYGTRRRLLHSDRG